MKLRHWITGIVLLLLMALAVVGLLRTREQNPGADDESGKAPAKRLQARAAAKRPLVDQRPLQTARRMAAIASTPEELALAHKAEKIGDHEVDLAFYDALRTAEDNPPPLSAEAAQHAERKNKAADALKEDQERIAQLTRRLAAAPASQKDNLQDQIDVAKAQMDLDQDEFDDAAEDLEQAGGDPQSKIKRLKSEHDASDQNHEQAASAVNPHEQDYQAHTMLRVGRAWRALSDKRIMLEEARQEATTKAQHLAQRRGTLTAQVEKEKDTREAAKQQARGFAAAGKGTSREASKAGAQPPSTHSSNTAATRKILPISAGVFRMNRN
jgi:chromosome segregation ATPase